MRSPVAVESSTTYSVTAAAYATITRKASNYAHTFIRLFNNPLGNNTALTVTIQFNITKPGQGSPPDVSISDIHQLQPEETVVLGSRAACRHVPRVPGRVSMCVSAEEPVPRCITYYRVIVHPANFSTLAALSNTSPVSVSGRGLVLPLAVEVAVAGPRQRGRVQVPGLAQLIVEVVHDGHEVAAGHGAVGVAGVQLGPGVDGPHARGPPGVMRHGQFCETS